MAGGGQGAPGAQGGQFGGMPLGNGMGQGSVPGQGMSNYLSGTGPSGTPRPNYGGPNMFAGGSPGFREGGYPQPGQMPSSMPGGMDQQRNPMLGGMKGPMGGMLPEDMLNMMRQRQQQGLLGGMKTGGPDDQTQMPPMPQGVGIGMSPPRLPPQQSGYPQGQNANEMAQIMAQYQPR